MPLLLVIFKVFGLLCNYEACYNLKYPKKKRRCVIKNKGKKLKYILVVQEMDFKIYRIQTHKFPTPQREHVYKYLFPQILSFEKCTTRNPGCLYFL